MSQLLIYGAGTFGQYVKLMVQQRGGRFAGFIDDFNEAERRVGTFEEAAANYPPDQYEIVIAIGYNHLQLRWEAYRKAVAAGYRVPKLIHPRACVADESTINDGAIVMMGAIADCGSRIGELAVLWPGAVVNHDSTVGSNTFVGPNATICGFTNIGNHCFIGAGSVIPNNTTVADRTFVKAGTVYVNEQSIDFLRKESSGIRAGMKFN